MDKRKVSDFSIEQKTFAPPLDQIKYAIYGLITQHLRTALLLLQCAHCHVDCASTHKKFPDVVLANPDLNIRAYTGIPRWSTT